MITDFLILVHPFIVHVSITCILLSFITSLISFSLWLMEGTSTRTTELKSKFFSISYFLLIVGELTLPISIISGFVDADSLTFAANHPILSFKIRMAFILFFILLNPILLQIYSTRILNNSLFDKEEKLLTILYILLLFIGTLTILIIGAAGGYYVYGHSFFDNIGLGEFFPELIPTDLRRSVFDTVVPSIVGSFIYLLMILLPFRFRK